MSSSQEVGGARRKVRDSSNVTNAIGYASGHGTNTINISNCNFHVGSNITSSATEFEDEIDWEDEDVKRHINGFIIAHNNKTNKSTLDKVTATFTNLKTPKKQVNPRFIDADYYRGKITLKLEEYAPEGCGRRSIDGKPIELDKTLDGINYAAIVADAGAGKTTTAKRFSQMVLKKQIPSLEHIKLVRYVTIATLNSEKEYTVFDLLFSKGMGSKLSKEMKHYGYYWVKKHTHEILLVLDGLDQANWVLDRNIYEDISYDELAPVPVIFYNILNRKVLEECKIVLTSREHAIRHIPPNARPERTVLLDGLTFEDRVYLILELAAERGEDILQHLRQNSSNLLSLCESPAFLVFTVAVYKDNSRYSPNTMSEILIRVLVKFLGSENQRERSLQDIFCKLKQLAYNLTKTRRVLFKSCELTSLGLSIDQVNDLVVPTPGESASDDFKIMEGQFNLFFCHQSIQEALTALYVCGMEFRDFKKFMDREINESHYRVVRKIILAILLNPRMEENIYEHVIGTISGKRRKSKAISRWLTVQILENRKEAQGLNMRQKWLKFTLSSVRYVYEDDIELCTLLHECGSNAERIIEQKLLSSEFLGYFQHFANLFHIFAVLSHDEVVADNMKFYQRGASDIKFFADCLRKCSRVETETLHFPYSGGRLYLETNAKTTQTSTQNVLRKHIKVLDLGGNEELEPDGFQYIGEIIKQCVVEVVRLKFCKLSANKVSRLQEGIDGYSGKIKILNLFRNKELEPDGYQYIGEIIKQCKIEEVKLWWCNLSADKVSRLQNGIHDYSGKVKFQTDFGDFESLEELMRVGDKTMWPQKMLPWE